MSSQQAKEHERMDEEQRVAAEEELTTVEEAAEEATNESQAETAEGAADPRVAELEKQLDDANNRALRAQADFDNYRRRTLKEKEELAQYASLKLIGQLLPVVDNFSRAVQSGEQSDLATFAKGVDMIHRQLWQVLEAEGLKAMEPVGEPFDPELHQAIMQVESDEYGEGTVVEVVQQGYWLKEKVIRPAMVKVSG